MRIEGAKATPLPDVEPLENLPAEPQNEYEVVLNIPDLIQLPQEFLGKAYQNTPKALVLSTAILGLKFFAGYSVLSPEGLFFGVCSGALASRGARKMSAETSQIEDPLSKQGAIEMVKSTPFKCALVAAGAIGAVSGLGFGLLSTLPMLAVGTAVHHGVNVAQEKGWIETNRKEAIQDGVATVSLATSMLNPMQTVFSMALGGALGSALETCNAAYDVD